MSAHTLHCSLVSAQENCGGWFPFDNICQMFYAPCNCQTPDLGQGLEFDFTFANNNKNKNNNNDPHPNFPGWDGTRGLKFGIQT